LRITACTSVGSACFGATTGCRRNARKDDDTHVLRIDECHEPDEVVEAFPRFGPQVVLQVVFDVLQHDHGIVRRLAQQCFERRVVRRVRRLGRQDVGLAERGVCQAASRADGADHGQSGEEQRDGDALEREPHAGVDGPQGARESVGGR
jgi:hypothetical protein